MFDDRTDDYYIDVRIADKYLDIFGPKKNPRPYKTKQEINPEKSLKIVTILFVIIIIVYFTFMIYIHNIEVEKDKQKAIELEKKQSERAKQLAEETKERAKQSKDIMDSIQIIINESPGIEGKLGPQGIEGINGTDGYADRAGPSGFDCESIPGMCGEPGLP